jgi:hypothetical protein
LQFKAEILLYKLTSIIYNNYVIVEDFDPILSKNY